LERRLRPVCARQRSDAVNFLRGAGGGSLALERGLLRFGAEMFDLLCREFPALVGLAAGNHPPGIAQPLHLRDDCHFCLCFVRSVFLLPNRVFGRCRTIAHDPLVPLAVSLVTTTALVPLAKLKNGRVVPFVTVCMQSHGWYCLVRWPGCSVVREGRRRVLLRHFKQRSIGVEMAGLACGRRDGGRDGDVRARGW
jgi:hypothetical protein